MGKRGEPIGLASLFYLEAAAALAWGINVSSALADRRAMQRLQASAEEDGSPTVTLIVPARNEAHNVGAWLGDVRRQEFSQLKVIVADDSSEDDTAKAALMSAQQDARIQVLRCQPPPAGWVGKCWAAHEAALRANSEWLIFSDADMRVRPQTIASALAAARRLGADALSLVPTLECVSWPERHIMPVISAIIFSSMPVWLIHDERFSIALMAGGFMLVRRESYFRAGGHAAVRASIAEDRDLSERLKAFGSRIRLLDGSAFVRVRMYCGLAQMWVGWRKNFFEGVRRSPWGAGAAVLASVAMLVLPLPVLLALGARRLQRPLSQMQTKLAFACGVSVLATTAVRMVRDRAIGMKTSAASIVMTPVAGLFFAAVMAASAWRIVSGRGQRWKGRTIH